MASPVIIDCIRAQSGYFDYDYGSGVYSHDPGGSDVYIGFDFDSLGNALFEYRAAWKFNTRDSSTGVPAGATITKVEFYYNPYAPPTATAGSPNTWVAAWYAGNILGATFDGTAGEWSGGSLVHEEYGELGTVGKWIDLTAVYGSDWIATTFDRSGDTDFIIRDTSMETVFNNASWYQSFWNGLITSRRTQLRITYVTPPPPANVAALATPHAGI